jgi:hypothetical protein
MLKKDGESINPSNNSGNVSRQKDAWVTPLPLLTVFMIRLPGRIGFRVKYMRIVHGKHSRHRPEGNIKGKTRYFLL